MKDTGIARRCDELGRVTIPIDIRRSLGLLQGVPVEFVVDNDLIVCKRHDEKGSKSVNAVYHMDHLGRLVIPVEIRRRFCIREGCTISILITDRGDLALQKFVSAIDSCSAIEKAIELVTSASLSHSDRDDFRIQCDKALVVLQKISEML